MYDCEMSRSSRSSSSVATPAVQCRVIIWFSAHGDTGGDGLVPLVCVEDPSEEGDDLVGLQVLQGQLLDPRGHGTVVEQEEPATETWTSREVLVQVLVAELNTELHSAGV